MRGQRELTADDFNERVRTKGGGRPLTEKKTPKLLTALEDLLADETGGDPSSGLKWTHKSLRKIQKALATEYPVSLPTISRLLRARDYSLRVNHKRLAGQQSPDRDQQFRYLIVKNTHLYFSIIYIKPVSRSGENGPAP